MKSWLRSESFFLKKFIHILNREMVPLEIIDANGNRYSTSQREIKHKLFIRDKKFFKALISPNAFALGEAYVNGYFDISGNLKELYEQVCDKLLITDQRKNLFDFFSKIRAASKKQERENIEYHYDVPAAFYQLFLGNTMGYTCGYYVSPDTTMDQAQTEKMEIICKKLRLKQKEHLLDVGCGWGNLALHAAKNYGVKVTGITLSSVQKKYAENWIKQEGFSDQIQIKILNYRDLPSESYDKISCVGMSEHVGKSNMQHFFNTIFKSLKPGGLFMQHTITTHQIRKKGYENSFLDKYMFPGGELMFEHELLDIADNSGFELLNAENFRPHYVRTLNDWITRMEKNKEKLLDIVSDHMYRIYHIFFIGSVISFQQKEIALFQNLFYKTQTRLDGIQPFISPYANEMKAQ